MLGWMDDLDGGLICTFGRGPPKKGSRKYVAVVAAIELPFAPPRLSPGGNMPREASRPNILV